MAKREFQLTQEQVKELTYAYTCCKDGPTRTRYQAVRLYGTGYPVKEVMETTGCSRPTLMEWCRKYRAAGISALAAQAVGASPQRILWVHTGPNILGPAIVLMTTNLGAAILSLTALPFLGLGVQPPQAEWGAMINGSRSHFQSHPWTMLVPGLAISITVLAVSILGDALRDFFAPAGWDTG